MTLRLIISGGIGSGKSAVGEELASRGAVVIQADHVGHAVLEPGAEAYAAVAELWPQVLVGGRIDRAALGRIVFTEPAALRRLEAITHPAIRARIAGVVAASDAEIVVVELPIPSDMLGPGWIRVVVDAPTETRRQRLLDRGHAADDIDARMSSQPSREAWLALADEVVDNSGDRAELAAAVDALLERLDHASDEGDASSGGVADA